MTKGLKVILVVENGLAGDNNAKSRLQNFVYDNESEDMAVFTSPSTKRVASDYGVNVFPATFLIAGDGKISQSWENTVLPAQLALSIEELLLERLLKIQTVEIIPAGKALTTFK